MFSGRSRLQVSLKDRVSDVHPSTPRVTGRKGCPTLPSTITFQSGVVYFLLDLGHFHHIRRGLGQNKQPVSCFEPVPVIFYHGGHILKTMSWYQHFSPRQGPALEAVQRGAALHIPAHNSCRQLLLLTGWFLYTWKLRLAESYFEKGGLPVPSMP